jgi:hypothetical protein
MNLKKKMVWDLSLDEIEYIYRNRHMNNYVYAALKTYHTSSPPLNRPVSLRPDTIPPCLCSFIEKLLEFSPLIGHDDPSYVQVGITLCADQLQAVLHKVQLEDIPIVVQLLTACAYLSITSGKNNKILLWKQPVVRPKNRLITKIIKKLLKSTFIEEAKAQSSVTRNLLYDFMPKVMGSIIICMENGDNPELIEQALLSTEHAMRTYEHNHGHVDPRSPVRVCDPKQIRYRNTLYLYGGMFFEKQGQYDRAVDWYLKDINHPVLPSCFCWSHLMAFKTIERLMSAYHLITDTQLKEYLEDLIHRSFVEAFKLGATYSQRKLGYFETRPSIDIRSIWLSLNEQRSILYGGEKSREVFFVSLLYNKFILGTDYRDIEYARFFKY